MNAKQKVHIATKEALFASFGSGDDDGRSAGRARGNPRGAAPGGALKRLRQRAARGAGAGGRGRATRRRLLQEIDDNARRSRGGPRLSNAVLAEFDRLLREAGV